MYLLETILGTIFVGCMVLSAFLLMFVMSLGGEIYSDDTSQSSLTPGISQSIRMIQDLEKYPSPEEGVYKNVEYKMKRLHNSIWGGYVKVENVSDEMHEKMEELSHGGITGGCDGMIGFDCSHLGDYPLCADGIYRDRNYVLAVIHRMIDELQ